MYTMVASFPLSPSSWRQAIVSSGVSSFALTTYWGTAREVINDPVIEIPV